MQSAWKEKSPSQMNLFLARMDQIINAEHELVQLVQELNRQGCESRQVSTHISANKGVSIRAYLIERV